MRAWLIEETQGPASLRLGELPLPEPGSGQVRVRMRTAGLNHLDLWVTLGLPAPKSLPHVVGADGAGLIDAVGEGVTGWQVGDEVILDPTVSDGTCQYCLAGENVLCRSFGILGEELSGTLAEAVVVATANLRRKPADLSWEVAGSFGLVTATAYRMLSRARLHTGETVLVVGVGGGVSSAAALVARALGGRVLVTSRHPEKLAWAMDHGAEAGFDSTGEFSKEVKAYLGAGVDVVVENVGPATWEQSIRSLGPGGRLVICGGTSGTKVSLHLPALWFKQLEIIGSTMANRAEFARALQLVATGKVDLPIDRVYRFEDLPEAMARLQAGEQLGKLVIQVVA